MKLHHFFTITRLVSGILFFFLFKHDYWLACVGTIVYALVSDGLDGYLARLANDNSSFGAILDVIADKFFLYCVFFSIYFYKEILFLNYVLYIWLLRDFVLIFAYFFYKTEFKSLYIGKIYTILQFFFVFLLMFLKNFYLLALFIFLFFVIGVSAIISYYNYFKK